MNVQSISSANAVSYEPSQSGQNIIDTIDLTGSSNFSEDAAVLTLSDMAHTFNIGDGWSVKLNQVNAVEEISSISSSRSTMDFVV